jgi:hypothetical protein
MWKTTQFERALGGFADVAVTMEEDGWLEESHLWRNSFPLCDLGTLDAVGLLRRPNCSEDDYPVIYLSADGNSHIIDNNLDSFLRHWEQLYYIWPSTLLYFCDPTTGRITQDSGQWEPLHRLFADLLPKTGAS